MSKNNGWIPLDKNLVNYLPKDRPYTKLEALFSHQLDLDNKTKFSINGYAKLWQWSRCKVRLFLKAIRHPKRQSSDTQATLSRHHVDLIILDIEKQKDSQATPKRHLSDTPKDTTIKTKRKTKTKTKDIAPKKGAIWQEATPMNLDQFINWCRKSNQPHVQIIGEWADELSQSFKFSGYGTYGEWKRLFFNQNLRAARDLEPSWKQETGRARMSEATKLLVSESKNGHWKTGNLSTLIKYMSKV